jgi:hypothetical protein
LGVDSTHFACVADADSSSRINAGESNAESAVRSLDEGSPSDGCAKTQE